jgi:ATP-dependent RNA helicase DDX52/ROK1
MDQIFNILTSSARIDKTRRKHKKQFNPNTTVAPPRINTSNSTSASIINSEDTQQQQQQGKRKKNHSSSKLQHIHREEIAAFRNKLGINLSQPNKHDPTIPDPISSFMELSQPQWWDQSDKRAFESVRNAIVNNIEKGRWVNPTPIQMQAMTALLGRRDVLGCAPTGSGKSGAFIVPSLLLSSVSDDIFYNKQDKKESSNGSSNSNSNSKGKSPQPKKKSNGGGKIRGLLLAPSRELASQLHREVQRLGEGKLHGLRSALLSKSNAATICSNYDGSNPNSRGLDILVSTPLRLLECLENGASNKSNGKTLDLGSVRVVILDEADRLLDSNDGGLLLANQNNTKSFNDSNHDNHHNAVTAASEHKSGSSHVQSFLGQIDSILREVPSTAVRALFSATIGSSVRHLAESILRNEIDISTGHKIGNSTASGVNENISQTLQFCGKEEGKLLGIRQIIAKGLHPPAIIFLQSKERAQALYLELMYDNVNVDVVHAGKSQAARDAAVAKFRKGETWILICTDLCARGLDFKAVNMVINYDLPTSGVTYVHRIGRCGRAGRKGEAITFFTEADFANLRNIANVIKLSGCHVEDWMLSVKPGRNSKSKIPMKRKSIDTSAGYDKTKRHKREQFKQHSRDQKKAQS